MIGALVRKEARLQLPYLILLGVIAGLGIAEPLLGADLELASAHELSAMIVNDDPGSGVFFFVLVFSFAVGLLVREVDERTQEFVDALPSSRVRVFLAKVGFALGALSLLPLEQLLHGALRFHLSASSLRPDVPWSWLACGAAITCAQIVSLFGFGLVLSFARPYAWIGAGIVFWVYQLVKRFWPAVGFLDPFSIGRGMLDQAPVVWPLGQIAAQLGLGAASGAAALVLFLRAGEKHASEGRRRWMLVPITGALALAILLFFFGSQERNEGTLWVATFAAADGRTRHYQVRYPASLADRAQVLLERADRVHDRVAEALGVEAAKTATIAIDASGSRGGTAGMTTWTTIRLDLAGTEESELDAVLGHETAHVYLSRLSGGVLEQDQDSAALFQEGAATFLEYRLFRSEEDLAKLRAQAAALRERHDLDLDALLDRDAMVERYGTELYYPLGERFFATLAARHGLGALRRLLAAMASDTFPRQTRGPARWRIAFQESGYDLDAEVAAWRAALAGDAVHLRAAVDALPTLQADLRTEEGDLVLDLGAHVPAGYALACRFRRSASTPEGEQPRVVVVQGRGCTYPLASLPRPVEYQLGLLELGSNRQLWDRWTRVPLQ